MTSRTEPSARSERRATGKGNGEEMNASLRTQTPSLVAHKHARKYRLPRAPSWLYRQRSRHG
jgi:hypothetical protein